uniref:HTH arsR-type domain-containing protein n=1 Tax=Thermosporothrix sp. COM3 TaxID=2490863 RepID=A0A455SMM3_9CHLR|nr:hypothetical protein KTC_21960 [Thermosporothrix sp. COM3]
MSELQQEKGTLSFQKRSQKADRALTQFLALVCSPMRRRMLELLASAETESAIGLSTNEIARNLYLAPSTASEHLNSLAKERLVVAQKQGSSVYYRLTDDPRVRAFLHFLREVDDHYMSSSQRESSLE